MRQLLRYAAPQRGELAVALAVGLVSIAASLTQPRVVREVLERIGDGRPVTGPVLLLMALVASAAALAGLSLWLVEVAGERVVLRARREIAGRLTRLTATELDRTSPADLVARATSDATLLKTAAAGALVELVSGTVGLVGALALMVLLDVRLAVVTMLAIGTVALLLGLVLPRLRAAARSTQVAVGELGAVLDRALGAARTVKASGTERRESAAAERVSHRAFRAAAGAARFHALGGVGNALAFHLPVLVVLGSGGVLVSRGDIGVPVLTSFLLYVFFLAEPLSSLVIATASLQAGLAAVDRIEEVRSLEVEDELVPGVPPIRVLGEPPTIRLSRVRFAHDGRASTLDDVSFEAVRGGLTVLVGPSGSGKSTVLSLLLRFYTADAGRIELGGQDLESLSRAWVRSRVGYVEQDAPILDGTLEENLTYAAPAAGRTEIERVLRTTRLDALVAGLPHGLATPVGPRGVQLSGGERQRLAVARALLRQPGVLLLDEATSQLDAGNDRALRASLAALRGRCTVVAVAHRGGTVADADRVVLMSAGRVTAVGSPAELRRSHASFRDLFPETSARLAS